MRTHDTQDEAKVTQTLHEVMSRVGLQFGVSVAERARLCAEELLDTGDEEVIRHILTEGWERELSRIFSRMRAATRKATRDVLASGKAFRGGNGHVEQQLAFPIIVPGKPPVLLAQATNILLAAALEAEEKQLQGRLEDVALLRRAERATRRWPDTAIADLLARRLVTLDDLFGEATA